MAELKFQQPLLQSLVSHDTYMSYSIPFHLITYQMLLSKATYKWGQQKKQQANIMQMLWLVPIILAQYTWYIFILQITVSMYSITSYIQWC